MRGVSDENRSCAPLWLVGKYQLVYVTPEKLVGVGNMLESLRRVLVPSGSFWHDFGQSPAGCARNGGTHARN